MVLTLMRAAGGDCVNTGQGRRVVEQVCVIVYTFEGGDGDDD